jgi:hypothetical protein
MSSKTFDQWMLSVDNWLVHISGLSSDMMEDWSYRSDYDEGITPRESAKRALEYNGAGNLYEHFVKSHFPYTD